MFLRKKAQPAVAPTPVISHTIDGEPDIRGLGRLLWQRKGRIIAATLICAAGAYVVASAITPRYRSESRLLLEARENVFMRANADKTGSPITVDPEAVTSQIQVVLSRDLARRVIAKERLADNPEFNSAAGSRSLRRTLLGLFGLGRGAGDMSREERTMDAFYDRLNVFAVEKSRVIVVDFSSADPKLAARIANAVADGYLKMQQAAKQQQTRAAGDWLAGEIEKMRKKVADAEAKVEAYRQKSNLFVGANNTMLPNQQLSEINSQIAAARGKKADLEARARQLRVLVRSGRPIDSSDIANSESMRRLIERRNTLRSELAEQSTTLLSRHPRIKELKAQIAEADRQIRNEGERLARQLDNDAKVAGERLETLSASLNLVKKMASQTSEQGVKLRALEGDAKTQRDLLESYLAKYREATARDSINAAPPEARIISRAVPALAASYPKKVPMVLIAAVAGFLLSAGFTVTGALLAPMPARVGYGYGYAPVGYGAVVPPAMPVMPRMTSPPLVPPTAAAPPPVPSIPPVPVSSIEQVAANLHESGDSGRRVAVIGTMRNVGTTFAAITLARALVKDSNVVLLDLAFGAPNVSVVSTDPKAPGIAELIRGQASFGDIITRDQYSQVHLVATGDIGRDGPAFGASPMLATVLEALVRSYDHVVIDAGSAADTAIERFAPLAHRAVLVASDPANPSTRATRERLVIAGFGDVSVVAGADEPAVA